MSSLSRNVPNAGDVDWDALTPESRWTLRHVAVPMMEGETHRDITETTGLSAREITARLDDLKTELREQTASVTTSRDHLHVAYTRALNVVYVEASDLELARWRSEARRRQMSLDRWIREAANEAAG